METLITRPIESALRGTPNVTGIRSNTMYGVSWVTLSFEWGTDYYFARQLITQNLTDVIPRLPLGTRAPIMSNAASRLGEVVEYYIKGDLPPLDLRELANYDVRYHILSVPGVWRVWNMGGEVRQYQVLLDMLKMRFLGVSLNQVVSALQDNNENFTGNIILKDPVEYATRGLGRITKLNDLYHIAIAANNGIPLYLKDVAAIKEGGEFRRGLALIDNKEVVVSTVTKHYGVDTIPVICGVKKALREIQSMLPSGVEIKAFFDQSELVNLSIRNREQQDGWLTRHSLKGYLPLCNTALKRPKLTCITALVILGMTTLLVPLPGASLLPIFDEGALVAVVITPPGASLKETARISDKVAQMIKQAPDVKEVIQRVGRPEGSEMPETANIGEMYVQLVDWKERRHSIDDIKDWMRKSVEDFPGTIISFTTPLNDRIEESISGVRGQLSVNVFGSDLDILVQKGNQLGEIMQHTQGVMDVGVEQTIGILQLNMLVDRERANRYGLGTKMIGDAVETAMGGEGRNNRGEGHKGV